MKLTARTPLLAAALTGILAIPGSAQEHPARRVANIVSVAVEEYGKAFDTQGKLVSQQEYSESVDFLTDAKRAAERLAGVNASAARALLDSIALAVRDKKRPETVDSLQSRFGALLGNEAKLDLPTQPLDLAEGKAVYERTCAACHGVAGMGDGPAGVALNPRPPALAGAQTRTVTPAYMYRVVSVGIAGTPMAGYGSALTPIQRWNVVSYITTMRSTHAQQLEGEGLFAQRCSSCHGVVGGGDGPLARSLTKLPPEIGVVSYQVERTDEQLANIIRNGVAASLMPPSRDLTDAQVTSMVAYLRTLPLKERNAPAVAQAGDSLNANTARRNVLSLLDQALAAARSGRQADAGDKAFDAYIAFEPLETKARARNPGLVATMEKQFADFKAATRNSDVRQAEKIRDAIEASLPEIMALAAPTGSGFEAFWQSFLIILREGFEAILVIGAIVAMLIKTGHRERLKKIWAGVTYALLASAGTAIVLKTVLAAMPASREIIEGITLLVAVAVLFSVSYWLISKVEAAKWQQFIKEKVNAALEQGGGNALTFVAFLAVYREGAEVALFYQALFNEGPNVALPLTLGIFAGFAVLAVVFTGIYRFGVKIRMRLFFGATSLLLYYMAFVFMGKGVRELQEGNAVSMTAIPWFPHVEWLGLFPSWEGVAAQFALVVLFAFALLKTFWPKRSVTLPVVQPSAPPERMTVEVEKIKTENQELKRRLAALEEAMAKETAS